MDNKLIPCTRISSHNDKIIIGTEKGGKMKITEIPTESRNGLCFNCEHCIQTVKGKECMLDTQIIKRNEVTGMLVCENREKNED